MIPAGDLLVEQGLANTGTDDSETRHAIDGVNGQAEAISLVPDGQFQGRINIAFFLVSAHVDASIGTFSCLTWESVIRFGSLLLPTLPLN